MNINFEYHNVKASDRLEIMAAQRLSKLEDKYDFIISSDVYFKNEKFNDINSNKTCKVRVSTPGPVLFAESTTKSLEASIADVMGNLKRQLQKRKEKMQTH